MIKPRLKLIVATGVVFTVAVVITGLFVREIMHQSEELRAQVSAVQKDQSQQSQLTRLKKLALETKADRDTVESYYLASLSDSIHFLNYVETIAGTQGVALETLNVTEVERDKKQILTVQYKLGGSKMQLENFVSLLENVSFVSEVVSVDLKKNTQTQWGADVTMEVIVLNQYETIK